jgi:hypothetical protein
MRYAKDLGVPILPAQVGEVGSHRIDRVFTVDLVDYRSQLIPSACREPVGAIQTR